MVRSVAEEIGTEAEIEETPDKILLKVKDGEGNEREMRFMKMGGSILVAGGHVALEEVVEARLRFPDDSVKDAVEKLEKLKESERD